MNKIDDTVEDQGAAEEEVMDLGQNGMYIYTSSLLTSQPYGLNVKFNLIAP